MVVIEKDGLISVANTHFCRLVGQPTEEIERKANICDYLTGATCNLLLEQAVLGEGE